MLKFQILLIAVLIACLAFVSCERMQQVLGPAVDDMKAADDTTATDDMTKKMMGMMDSKMHMSWANVTLPAPTMTVAEAAAAMNPGGTGAAHGTGTRTVYFNEAGAMANMAGTAYPAGTMIVKEVMDVTETFVAQVVTMMKTDDPMYAAYNGWVYGATQRASETEELMMPQTVPMAVAASCHGCHAKASNDSVFVSLSMDDMTKKMMDTMDSKKHMSWANVTLPAPTMTVAEAAAAMNPGGTGAAHGMGSRTVYFNEAGAMANMAGTAYPADTMIVKEVMDVTETFVAQVVTMMKTDDPMYAAYNGWVYGATQRASETEELMMPQTVPMEVAASCHGCHAKASDDSVFVSLSMDDDGADTNDDGAP